MLWYGPVERIRAWGESVDWSGADPGDALNSPFARYLTLGTARGRRALTQAVRRSPVDLRPLLRVPPARSPAAIGLVASGYARLWQATGWRGARRHALELLDWLVAHPARTATGTAWGEHFDVQTRDAFRPAGTPGAAVSSLCAQALFDGVELLEEDRYAEPLRRFAEHAEAELLVDDGAGAFFASSPGDRRLDHDANLAVAAALVRGAQLGALPGGGALAEAVLQRTLAAQQPDGSFRGVGDGVRAGRLLQALAVCAAGRPRLALPLRAGASSWERRFFLADGRPTSGPGRAFPVESRCYAQAVETRLALRPFDGGALGRADDVARLLVARMLDERGFVHFREHRLRKDRTPFVPAAAAPSFRALASLLAAQRAPAESPSGAVGARLD
jgi:hypothetical protein